MDKSLLFCGFFREMCKNSLKKSSENLIFVKIITKITFDFWPERQLSPSNIWRCE